MRVYISGKIGELEPSPSTVEKFAKAEEKLRARGFDVFNPISTPSYGIAKNFFETVEKPLLKEGECLPDIYTIILTLDIINLSRCHAIYLLEDYKKSPGALTEAAFAFATGKKCFFQNFLHASAYLEREYNKLWATGHPPLQRKDGEDTIDLRDRYLRMHMDKFLIR